MNLLAKTAHAMSKMVARHSQQVLQPCGTHIVCEQREDMLFCVLPKDGASASAPLPVAVARRSADDAFVAASVADEGTDLLEIIGGADTQ